MSNSIDPRCQRADGTLMPSSELIVYVRDNLGYNRVLLALSGRDSLCCWLMLRDHGIDVIPYWCYTVPGLSYDDEMIDYLERFFDRHIIRLPHPRTYELLRSASYQPPESAAVLYRCNLVSFEFADIENKLAQEYDLGDDYLCSVGMRAADNLMRHRLIHQLGTLGFKRRHYYYTVWDWKTADVKQYLHKHRALLSKSYVYFGSTGDGIDYNFIIYLKNNLPDDYRRVLDVFPLADIELFRYDIVSDYANKKIANPN